MPSSSDVAVRSPWSIDPLPCCCVDPFVVQDADAATTESFEWLSQLRFDFDPNAKDPTQGLTVRMADAKFEYGFEYLGIGERLVQTPLTDRCVCGRPRLPTGACAAGLVCS